MSIIFILILISALSSYIFLVNDQVSHSYDIVVHVEKSLKFFYETEFVISYIVSFYQKNCVKITLPYSKNFDLYYSPAKIYLKVTVTLIQGEIDILAKIIICREDLAAPATLIDCNLVRENNNLIKIKKYIIENKSQ